MFIMIHSEVFILYNIMLDINWTLVFSRMFGLIKKKKKKKMSRRELKRIIASEIHLHMSPHSDVWMIVNPTTVDI